MGVPCDGKATGSDSGGSGKSPLSELAGKYNIVEPQWILPMPSPWCNKDWN